MTPDQTDIANFDQTANDPSLWTMRAEDLHLAATVLRAKVTSLKLYTDHTDLPDSLEALKYAGIAFQSAMLQGFAIEAFLKAYWMTQGNEVATNGEYKIPTIKKDAHDLPLIADGVGFTLSQQEREVLGRLSLFVSSYGRYPITKKWHQNRMTKDKQGTMHRLAWNNEDHTVAEAVIERLRNLTTPKTATPAQPPQPGGNGGAGQPT